MSSNIKSFVSEKQIEEKRKVRQEEWERVRKPEDPVTAPEEEYDPRSLYDRLKAQRDKKQEDFEETLKFKNHFRGINEEESAFLSYVNKRSSELEKQKFLEEKKELDDFKNAVSQSRELPEVSIHVSKEILQNATSPKKQIVSKRSNQQNILKAAVKRKADPDLSAGKPPEKIPAKIDENSSKISLNSNSVIFPSVTKCVGILPGLAAYSNDDSEESEDDDDSSSDDSGLISNNLLSFVVRKEH